MPTLYELTRDLMRVEARIEELQAVKVAKEALAEKKQEHELAVFRVQQATQGGNAAPQDLLDATAEAANEENSAKSKLEMARLRAGLTEHEIEEDNAVQNLIDAATAERDAEDGPKALYDAEIESLANEQEKVKTAANKAPVGTVIISVLIGVAATIGLILLHATMFTTESSDPVDMTALLKTMDTKIQTGLAAKADTTDLDGLLKFDPDNPVASTADLDKFVEKPDSDSFVLASEQATALEGYVKIDPTNPVLRRNALMDDGVQRMVNEALTLWVENSLNDVATKVVGEKALAAINELQPTVEKFHSDEADKYAKVLKDITTAKDALIEQIELVADQLETAQTQRDEMFTMYNRICGDAELVAEVFDKNVQLTLKAQGLKDKLDELDRKVKAYQKEREVLKDILRDLGALENGQLPAREFQ